MDRFVNLIIVIGERPLSLSFVRGNNIGNLMLEHLGCACKGHEFDHFTGFIHPPD